MQESSCRSVVPRGVTKYWIAVLRVRAVLSATLVLTAVLGVGCKRSYSDHLKRGKDYYQSQTHLPARFDRK